MSAVLKKLPELVAPITLEALLNEAGIYECADWCGDVKVTPSGNPEYLPRPYQISGLNHMAAYLPRAALYDDPGTGKTLQIQALMLWLAGIGNKCVAIMPPALVIQFYESLHTTFPGFDKHLTTGVVNGEREERGKQIDSYNQNGWPSILVMSYQTFLGKDRYHGKVRLSKRQQTELAALPPDEAEKLRRRLSSELNAEAKVLDYRHKWKPGIPITAFNFKSACLSSLGYTMLVADEAHKLKNSSSAIHQAVKAFVRPQDDETSEGLILATGSPIETNIEDAYGLISLQDPKLYPSMRVFDRMHCILLPGVKYRKVIEYVNLDTLYARLYSRGRRVTKKEAFADMPARVVTESQIKLHPDHKTLYDTLVDERVIELEDSVIDATTKQRLYQFMQQILLCPERFCDKAPKANAIIDEIDNILDGVGDRKVIVFAWYQESVEKLAATYNYLNPAIINGTVTGMAREREKSKFIKDKSCRMLIANPKSGGVGLDGFQHVCSYAIFAEVFPHPGGFEQAVGRLERSGQTEAVNIYIIVPKGTVAVKLRNDLLRKEEDANAAVRDKKTLMADLMGINGIRGVIK